MNWKQQKYQQLCEAHYIPWYASAWWMNAVANSNWEPVLLLDQEENIQAAFPIFQKTVYGLKMVTQPPFTTYTHLWMQPGKAKKEVYDNNRQQSLLKGLIAQIPSHNIVDLLFDEHLQNALPFHWEAYQNSVRYTYQFQDLSDLSLLHRNMESSARNHIRKAQSLFEVRADADSRHLHQNASESFRRKGIKLALSADKLEYLCESINKNANLCLHSAYDASNQAVASIAVVADTQRASFWLSGTTEAGRKSGAIYLLLWHTIKEVAKQVPLFDFEGSMDPGVEALYRSFGAKRIPYFRIQKTKPSILSWLRK